VCLELEEVAILELGIVEKGELSDKQVMEMVLAKSYTRRGGLWSLVTAKRVF
jgi:hypothetical protein